jgi:hypothetical protein
VDAILVVSNCGAKETVDAKLRQFKGKKLRVGVENVSKQKFCSY